METIINRIYPWLCIHKLSFWRNYLIKEADLESMLKCSTYLHCSCVCILKVVFLEITLLYNNNKRNKTVPY